MYVEQHGSYILEFPVGKQPDTASRWGCEGFELNVYKNKHPFGIFHKNKNFSTDAKFETFQKFKFL